MLRREATTTYTSPGPGHYNDNETGEISKPNNFASHYKSIVTPRFKTVDRTKSFVIRHQTPGPGAHRLPSDFGYMTRRLDRQSNLLIGTN